MKQLLSIILIIILTIPVFAKSTSENSVNADIVVAMDGSGDFTTVQEAIDATKAFPPQRITIFIKNGIYNEKVRIPAWNTKLSLIGENIEKTIISYNDYFKKINRGRNSTFFTYTLKVEADDFYAKNITIENTAGEVGQAVAIHIEGNRCSFNNCKFLGNQDTAYLTGENSKQLFTKCTISGTTDFIFGSATAVFDSCTIVSKRDSYITAASTTKEQEFGFVFFNCKLEACKNVNKVYLGRPWRPYAKTVFIACKMGKHIAPDGWKEWSNKEKPATTFYAEFNNYGIGADTRSRINWSHQLTTKQRQKYCLQNILGDW